MAEFVSMYQKDYLWPDLKPSFDRTELSCKIAVPQVAEPPTDLKPCPIGWEDRDKFVLQRKPCPKPEKIIRSEPDCCLKKLMEKHPTLFSVLRKVPTPEATKRFNAQRLTSTYQVDYDHLKEEPPADFLPPSKTYVCPADRTKEAQCKPIQRSRKALMRLRLGLGYEAPGKPCLKLVPRKKKKTSFEEVEELGGKKRKGLPPWSTEYRDAINRKGLEIWTDMKKEERNRMRMKKKNMRMGGGEQSFETKRCGKPMTFG